MSGNNFEYFQTLYKVNYAPGTGITGFATTNGSPGNLVAGSSVYEKLTASSPSATQLHPGDTGTTSLVGSTGANPIGSSFTYLGVVYDGSNAVGILVQSGGNYYIADVYKNGYTTAFTSTTHLTVNTSQSWGLAGQNFNTTVNGTPTENGNPTPVCFMGGTRIATPSGEVAVETLKAGDEVLTADGRTAMVTWLGRQTIATRFADPLRVQPIRVKAGALADGVPSRDLLLSPSHALLVDGVLAQASALVNGVSITHEAEMAESFIYYHVDVAEHELILAENTPAETFIDNVERMAFDNWDEHPGSSAMTEMDLPRAKSSRQVPAATRTYLLARSQELTGIKAAAAA